MFSLLKHVSHGAAASYKVFPSRQDQKNRIFRPKRAKNCHLFSQNTILEPYWTVSGPHTFFEGARLKINVLCRVLEQVTKCFRAAITKKNRTFGPKNGQKKAFFWPKIVLLGHEWLDTGLHNLVLELVDSETCVLQSFGANDPVLPIQNHRKTAFFCGKGAKKIIWPSTVFLGLEWSVVGPPTLFRGCCTQKYWFCRG